MAKNDGLWSMVSEELRPANNHTSLEVNAQPVSSLEITIATDNSLTVTL